MIVITSDKPEPTAAPRWPANPPAEEIQPRPAHLAVTRAVAAFFGLFSLMNVLGELHRPGFDANLWWIDLTPCPPPLARSLLAFAGILLLGFAASPRRWRPLRGLTALAVCILLGFAVWNTIRYYLLIEQGAIVSLSAVPFSLHVACCLVVVLLGVQTELGVPLRPRRDIALASMTLAACLVLFPLAQMYCFGQTDYRRSADVIVVFGCGVDAEGRPSDFLTDRVHTACRLYHDGYANRILLSGGPGGGDVHETEAMRRIALERGVPETALIVDPDGLDSRETVLNAARYCREHELRRVLAVSQFYHLPRVKLTFRRYGMNAYTVPANQTHNRFVTSRDLAREVAALWWYYARPLAD